MIVDPEFKALIPPLSPDEYAGLEASIIAEGCRDALVTWGEILIDGHNRFEICERHGLEYRTVKRDFPGRPEARRWVRGNQMGRRNLPDAWKAELALGDKADLLLIGKAKLGDHKSEEYKTTLSLNDKVVPPHNTQKSIADSIGMSTGKLAQAEYVKDKAPEIWEQAKAGELTIGGAYKAVKEAENPEKGKSNAMVNVWTGNQENYTPEHSIIAVRRVLGSIDLDPASCDLANKVVKAKDFYSEDDDGLSKAWYGNVFINPPYQQPQMGQFADKLIAELKNIKSAIMLVNNNTDTAWFHKLASEAAAFCFTKGRIHFYTVDNPATQPTNGQVYFYFGDSVELFTEVFCIQGMVVKTLSNYREEQ